MRLRLKLGKRSRSLGARGRGARPSIVSGEWVYGIGGLGEVAGGESTSAMLEVSVDFAGSDMRGVCEERIVWWSSPEVWVDCESAGVAQQRRGRSKAATTT